MNPLPLSGLRVVVVGLAREGSAAARFLAEQGARVTVTDARPPGALRERRQGLDGLDITFRLGGHPASLLEPSRTDLLVVSPGVPLDSPFLAQAQANRLPLTTETRLFCQLCPAPVIGVSGSSGKTTTTTLVGKMLEAAGRTVHVGGNIGQPLISRLPAIAPGDWVVMELSSFQLEYFHARLNRDARIPPGLAPLFEGWSPAVGALLNITPNHLDRHKTMEAYIHAKTSLVQYMGTGQIAVLGRDDPVAAGLATATAAQVRWFSRREMVADGACLRGGQITLAEGGRFTPVCPAAALQLRGEHNRLNVLAACALAGAAGVPAEAMASVARTFTGVPHRLEVVARRGGVTYVNDSIATSPERLIAALKSFSEPILLLAGGKDKDLPWEEAARLIVRRVKHLLLFGQAEELIYRAVRRAAAETESEGLPVHRCGTLEAAVAQARQLAQPGDVVLLSPGGTSFDAYPDFAARGEHFRRLAIGE